ncbi:50S ribosomal protein L30 [Gammaproteobacteria bacterium]|nr:50S ribosomal protein L30 [Gammaproteobacteria bacterium]
MSQIKVTLLKSTIGIPTKHRLSVKALGLSKIRQSRLLPNIKLVQGLIKKVNYLIKVENQ